MSPLTQKIVFIWNLKDAAEREVREIQTVRRTFLLLLKEPHEKNEK